MSRISPRDPRRGLGPAAVDLADALAANRIDRRDFLRRGAMLGLSATALAAVLQACASDEGSEPGVDGGARTDDVGNPTPPSTADRIVVGIRQGDATSGLDPVNMTEIGTYAVVAQSFEYLVGVAADGAVAPMALATSWSPNEDGSVWTFVLREGPTWSNGMPLTSSDVAATIDRVVTAGNAGFDGVVAEGSVSTPDERTAVFTLVEPNGNFPALLSPDNPQTLITPVDYRSGTTLDDRVEGTGPWILESFNAPDFVATYRANPAWWGGSVKSSGIELRGFGTESDALAALESGEIDALQRVVTASGRSLLGQAGFQMARIASSSHRQFWFNTHRGLFADRHLRSAIAWAVDRNAAIDDLDLGCGVIANDHPIHSDLGSVPFFDPNAVDQRVRDIERSRSFLLDAGRTELSAVLHTNETPDSMAAAELIRSSVAPAGITLTVSSEPDETFYSDTWCPPAEPGPACQESADFGIIENEHRALPDVVLGRTLGSTGVWNASNYRNPEFDRLFRQYRRSIDVDGQRSAIGEIQRIVWTDIPFVIPCFDDVVTGSRTSVSGVEILPSGQVILVDASRS
jgi:peptide/nickel transport system substrate-binding protein